MATRARWLGEHDVLTPLGSVAWDNSAFKSTCYGHYEHFGDGAVYPIGTYTVIGGGYWNAWNNRSREHNTTNWNIYGVDPYEEFVWYAAFLSVIHSGGTAAPIVAYRFDWENSVAKWKFTTTSVAQISTYLYDIPCADNNGLARFDIHNGNRPLPTTWSVVP